MELSMSSHASRRHLHRPVAAPASPEAAPVVSSGEITVVATGLAHPRGFTWGPDGLLYVALSGDGLSPPPTDGASAPPRPDAPPSVVRIEADGSVTSIAHGLPSTQDPYGDVQGPVDVAFLGDQLYVLQDATGGIEAVGLDWPNGIYAVEPDGGLRLVSSETVFVRTGPAEHYYHILDLGEPFAMVADDEGFWVVDANQGLLLHTRPEGTTRVVADLSLNHPVPTAIAHAPDGGFYVGYLGPGPHLDGEQKVVKVSRGGEVTEYWTGLAMVTGLAVGADGTLFALDMSTGNTAEPPNIYPNTGRLVRQTGPQSFEEVVTGLDYPISMAFGPDGGLYVSGPAITSDGGTGSIIRVDAASGETLRMPAARDVASTDGREGAAS
jgi:hypothetical protein